MDKKAIVEEYVEQKAIIKEAEARMKELQEEIKTFTEVDDQYVLDNATVTYSPGRASYKYSPELTERAAQVKEDQKEEVQTGIAEVVEGTPYLVVNFKK